MKYPSSWTVDDKNLTSGIKFISPDGPGAGAVVVEANETGKTFEDTVKNTEDFANSQTSNQSHGLKIIEMEKNGYFLSGHPALRSILIISFGGPGEPATAAGVEPHDIKAIQFLTISGGKECHVSYLALPENLLISCKQPKL